MYSEDGIRISEGGRRSRRLRSQIEFDPESKEVEKLKRLQENPNKDFDLDESMATQEQLSKQAILATSRQ